MSLLMSFCSLIILNLIPQVRQFLPIFVCLEEYLSKHNVLLRNIIAVATDGAPAMVGHYRGFSVFLKEEVLTVHTAHCVLHGQHLVVIKTQWRTT